MKGLIVLKSLVAIFLIVFLPKLSLANDGGRLDNIAFRQTLMKAIQDTTHPANAQTVENTNDKKNGKTIKVLPKPHRQPVPVPVKLKVPRVKSSNRS